MSLAYAQKLVSTPIAAVLLFLVIAALLGSPALASPGDGMVVGATKILDNGPDSDRFNLVLIGDGYTDSELSTFAAHADQFVEFLFQTPPFSTSCSAINIWRIDVSSTESGADDPAPPPDDPMTPADESLNCNNGTGTTKDTFFDSSFCGDGVIRRLLVTDNAATIAVLDANVPEWDQGLMIVNSSTYGGSGGSVGTTSVSGTWENIAIHEFGHSAFGLADEYNYWAGCGVDTDRDNHDAVEPVQPNVTLETDATLIKWKDLLDAAAQPLPTTSNADCSVCDPQGDPFGGAQTVGAYEGAHYYHCDAFRPVFSCMMRDFSPFCPVCSQRILATLEPFQPTNSAPICDANGPYLAECQGLTSVVPVNGTGSSDPDCDPLDFEWSGPFTGSPVAGSTPDLTFAGTGMFDVTLTVTDNEAAASACMAQVTVADTTAPDITAPPDTEAECSGPDGTPVDLGDPIVSDICDPAVMVSNDAPAVFPLGQTDVTWTATDASGNANEAIQVVTVEDTTPPELSLSVSPTRLWPPNHKLHEITADISVSDVCDPNPTLTLLSATSNEPDDDTGDGHTSDDIQGAEFGTDDRSLQLRAERKGNGAGRIYTLSYQAEDASGNSTPGEAEVTVAKSQGK